MFYETSFTEKKSHKKSSKISRILLDYHTYHYPDRLCALFERAIKGLYPLHIFLCHKREFLWKTNIIRKTERLEWWKAIFILKEEVIFFLSIEINQFLGANPMKKFCLGKYNSLSFLDAVFGCALHFLGNNSACRFMIIIIVIIKNRQ